MSPDTEPIVRVTLPQTRRWSREYAACRGSGEGATYQPCQSPDGAEFDAGRCHRCHVRHVTQASKTQALPPASTPVAPTPTPPTPPTITPRSWAKHYDWCVNCGTDRRKPMALGLCVNCYKASTSYSYAGRKGPNLLGVRDEAEQRRRVDAYLATIERPTPPVSAPPDEAAATNGAVVIETGWELDRPAPVTPPPVAARSVADELRALLDTLATERAAALEEQVRLTARLANLSTQCDAVQTTIRLVATKEAANHE